MQHILLRTTRSYSICDAIVSLLGFPHIRPIYHFSNITLIDSVKGIIIISYNIVKRFVMYLMFLDYSIFNVYFYNNNLIGYIFKLSSNLDVRTKEHGILVGESYNLIVELESVCCQYNTTLELVQFRFIT